MKTTIAAILSLFFFQLLAEFIEAVYVFGLLGASIPPEIVSVVIFLSPLVLLVWPRRWPVRGIVILGFLVILSRVLVPLMATRGRMLMAGFGVANGLLLIPLLITEVRIANTPGRTSRIEIGLAFGVALSILMKSLNSGVDLSTTGSSQVVGWGLAILAATLLLQQIYPGPTLPEIAVLSNGSQPEMLPRRSSTWQVGAFSLGIAAVIVLLYFVFTSPSVIARWTGMDRRLIIMVMILVLSIYTYFRLARPEALQSPGPATLFIANLIFVLSLTYTILAFQIDFPSDPGAFPLVEPLVSPIARLSVWIMILSFPILLIDFKRFMDAISAASPTQRALGGGFTLASIFILALIFGNVFTTVYDYIPVIGPYFRDRFWLIHLIAGLGLFLPFMTGLLHAQDEPEQDPMHPQARLATGLMVLIGATALSGMMQTAPSQVHEDPGGSSLRVLTFNIQQGYDAEGQRNYAGQLALIEASGADVIGLQESDTNRIAGGNADLVGYFADRLGMYGYYGPKPVTGTFGVALLSRFPILDPKTVYFYSTGEQTAAISARIEAGSKAYRVYVTHLGNGGPIIQQQQLLSLIESDESNVVMGDFNFRPNSEQYRLTTQLLSDSWSSAGSQNLQQEGKDPDDRIDHIFVSPGLVVVESRYLIGPQSDHPALLTEIAHR